MKRKRNSLITFLLAVTALLSVCFTQAEVITKGGGIQLRVQPKETASFAFTNGVQNPGLPLILRVTTWQATNHFGIQTNGVPAIVGLGTNYIGFSGAVAHTPAAAATLFFRHGLLIATNGLQQPTP